VNASLVVSVLQAATVGTVGTATHVSARFRQPGWFSGSSIHSQLLISTAGSYHGFIRSLSLLIVYLLDTIHTIGAVPTALASSTIGTVPRSGAIVTVCAVTATDTI
jgi:hypothetical protein